MKILQIAPIGLPVRPDITYGGTERVISYLDEVYTEMGHDSLVAATGESRVKGTLIKTVPVSIWGMNNDSRIRVVKGNEDMTRYHYKKCIDTLLSEGIDVVHDHPGSGLITTEEFEQVRDQIKAPILVTLHGAFSNRDRDGYVKWAGMSEKGTGVHFNAISESQRREFESVGIRVEDVVYHGIPTDRFVTGNERDDYLFTIGKIAHEKGQHIAIDIAKKSGRPLIIAGEVHSVNEDYWKEKIEPYVDGNQIRFVGPLTDEEKIPYFQNAAALIFPLQWKEPFGLVMIEAMACGTPVVAYDRGSVPEVVKDGVTGFVIKETGDREADLEAMVRAVDNLDQISPSDCRRHVEDNFSIRQEAENYLRLYRRLINSERSKLVEAV